MLGGDREGLREAWLHPGGLPITWGWGERDGAQKSQERYGDARGKYCRATLG